MSDVASTQPLAPDPFRDESEFFPAISHISEELEREYGSPRHGNKSDPLDELIYIILSTRTRDEVFQTTFGRLKAAFPTWDRLTPDRLEDVSAILVPGGLGRLKAAQIVAILDLLRTNFGKATLDPLFDMSDEAAEEFLTSLPGVAAKVAKCVMMYSLGRPVLPVDAHVHRVATRLGFRTKKRPDTSQDLIEGAVPPRLRYSFHVNAVAHGRTVCVPRVPRCDRCCIAKWCTFKQRITGDDT